MAGTRTLPTLREERRLLRSGHALIAGVDEVGRGALAGPVSVGVVVVGPATPTAPSGVRDSKLLTPAAREALAPRLRGWAVAHAVGHAEPEEIDRYGIIAALRLAAWRALAVLPAVPTLVLLDGSHDWLTPPDPGLFPGPEDVPLPDLPALPGVVQPRVYPQVKADLRCASVAAASVLAKVDRDAIMVQRAGEHPGYGWAGNKGYAAPDHVAGLRRFGACPQHRRSWRLPGVDPVPDAVPARPELTVPDPVRDRAR
jgi:ribonuclease HII